MPLAAVWIALTVAACTSPGAMSGTALDFNETVARAADSQLLLNIVRAAKRNPTHYSAITQVRDSRSLQGTASATGTVPFGPDATQAYPVSPTLSATGSLAPSFDVAPLDNRAAAEGLFHPINPQVPLTYWQQNWPKMVLLFLFVDDATINDLLRRACDLHGPRLRKQHIDKATYYRIDNAAYDIEQYKVARKLFQCLAPHLHLEPHSSKTTYLHRTSAPSAAVLKAIPDLDKGKFTFKQITTRRGHKLYSVSKTTTSWDLVLDFGGKHSVIGSRAATPNSPLSFDIRSVDGMVYYLGELVRLEEKRHEPPAFLASYERGGRIYYEREVLFHVNVDPGADPARNITADFLGERYAISRTPNERDRSLTVLALLEQLFALFREEKELPKTSAVEVVGTH